MEPVRDRIVRLIREMRNQTTDKGATPGEAAGFAGKVAEWIEKYEIEEAELRGAEPTPETVEVCQEYYWTGKQVHNPGVTKLITGLARGMSCQIILLGHNQGGRNAGYGVVGTPTDSQFVVQMTSYLLPQLLLMAKLEWAEHGYEKAGLIRWCNQYLIGASTEIKNRLWNDRKDRSALKVEQSRIAAGSSNALVVITGEKFAVIKKQAVETEFKRLYPHTINTPGSRSGYDGTARTRGQSAGKSIGLGLPINSAN